MSVFQNRLEQKPLLKDLEELRNDVSSVELKGLNKADETVVRRTSRILKRTHETLLATDPEFITVSMMDNLDQPLKQLRDAFSSCRESGQWDALVKRGDVLLQHLANFVPPAAPSSAEKDCTELLNEFRGQVSDRLEEGERALREQLSRIEDASRSAEKQSQEIHESAEKSRNTIENLQEAIQRLETGHKEVTEKLNATSRKVDELKEESNELLGEIEAKAAEQASKLNADSDERLKKQEGLWNELRSKKEDEFSAELNEWKSTFTDAENKRQQQFTTHQSDRATEFSNWKSKISTAVDELVSKWEKQLSAASKAHVNKAEEIRESENVRFDELYKELSKKASSQADEIRQTAAAARDSESDTAQVHLTAMKSMEEEARKLVGIIGNTGVTGNYQKTADQEQWTANWLRVASIFSLVAFGGVTVYIAWHIGTQDFNWEVALFRLLAGLPFAALAWYCGSESRRHRANEQRNRRIELELASLDPYLNQLGDQKALEVREALTEKYFGTGPNDGLAIDGQTLESVLREALKPLVPLVDLMKRIAK